MNFSFKGFLSVLLVFLLSLTLFGQSATVISERANLRGTASESGKIVDTLSRGVSMDILGQKGPWFLVQTTDLVGWIHGNTIRLGSETDVRSTNVPLLSQPRQTRTAPQTVTPRSTSGGYIRGPRGGCYYLNSSGKKTYVDRSLCN